LPGAFAKPHIAETAIAQAADAEISGMRPRSGEAAERIEHVEQELNDSSRE
jgi:hypothetical protein